MTQKTKIIPGELIVKENVKSSSSSNVYTINVYDNCISCNCPAGGKKALCKHVISAIHKNTELLKEKAPILFDRMTQLIEFKKNKGASKENLQQLYNELIYVNREIAETAVDNLLKNEIMKNKGKITKKTESLIATIYKEIKDMEFAINMEFATEDEYAELLTEIQDCINKISKLEF